MGQFHSGEIGPVPKLVTLMCDSERGKRGTVLELPDDEADRLVWPGSACAGAVDEEELDWLDFFLDGGTKAEWEAIKAAESQAAETRGAK